MKHSISVLALLFATGCANFEYNITQPADFAQHVGKTEERFTRDPVEYRLQTVDSRLVMLIYNNGDSPINLLGDRSVAVDQHGQSHPLRSVTIATHSYVKVILPPLRPYIEHNGPSVGFGIGVMGSANGHRYFHYPVNSEPTYLSVYYDDDAFYWEWEGETEVRITLVYQLGERTTDHEFVIAHKKV